MSDNSYFYKFCLNSQVRLFVSHEHVTTVKYIKNVFILGHYTVVIFFRVEFKCTDVRSVIEA